MYINRLKDTPYDQLKEQNRGKEKLRPVDQTRPEQVPDIHRSAVRYVERIASVPDIQEAPLVDLFA